MSKRQIIKFVLNLWRILAVYPFYRTSSQRHKIDMDIVAWNNVKNTEWSNFTSLIFFLLTYKEFRNIFLYRIKQNRFAWMLKILYPPESTLYIACDNIGGGLFIQHGFSTIIAAKEIGDFCWVNQQVTIGYKGDFAPVIGNNVSIYCGAIVIGNIYVADNVKIGAGSVVTKSISAGKIVVGNPAREIKCPAR